MEKVKVDELLRRKFRELADLSLQIKKLERILKESGFDPDSRAEWVNERNQLRIVYEKVYKDLELEGFEQRWIQVIVDVERENLNNLINNVREKAKIRYLGDVKLKDIDPFDSRIDMIGLEIKQAKDKYIEGK